MTAPSRNVPSDQRLAILRAVEQRVLWLAVRMVDHANRRPDGAGGIKVGGHQASSASMVSLMTALWFHHLRAQDRVAVKPHASPVFHAIQYLLGRLDASYLRRLRDFGGLQAYPSRTKDPDPVDFSTGSVGVGAVAPLFAAAARRYVDAHFERRPDARFVALLGDAELDEGNVWEAVAESAVDGLGSVLWVVDLNRQSLDRVVPGIRAARLERMFEANGWHVTEAKYGRRLQALFAQEGGEAVRRHIDEMSNERYQSLFSLRAAALRDQFLAGADTLVKQTVETIPNDDLGPIIQNLGGHDLEELIRCYDEADQNTDRPSVVFAYTVKGWGLPMAGDPLNHAAMLTDEQIDALREELGLDPHSEWDRFPTGSDEAEYCRQVAERLHRDVGEPRPLDVKVPDAVGGPTRAVTSTQDSFGRLLVALSRDEGLAPYVVTASPDVAVSTNLGGWINRVGVFDPQPPADESIPTGPLKWVRSPAGQHIELGISEMNLFSLLGALGLSWDHSDQPLLPIGTLYDPFVCRGLDALIHAVYSGAGFIFAGTPSGITLSPEGGAHQSTITASIGVELPGLVHVEPAYARALDWLLCAALGRLTDPAGAQATYLRLSTRPIEQGPFDAAVQRVGEPELRRNVLAGGYRLVEGAGHGPLVNLFAAGAVMPEVLLAQQELEREGLRVTVIDVTSVDLLYRTWQQSLRRGVREARLSVAAHAESLLRPHERGAPIVTVQDAASHTMAWLGSVFGVPVIPVGVDRFGESGSIPDLYEANELSAGHIVNAALLALTRT